jgi:phosphoribosylformylglycinamidine synthase
VFYQFREAVGGMGDACATLGTPVTGGNVSLYNESPTGAVYPTPVVGMVGLVEDLAHVTRACFTGDGDAIVLLGEPTDELGGSEYLARVHGVVAGAPPRVSLDAERALIEALLQAIRGGHVASAHDCSDGGLAVALAECCVADAERHVGADVDLSPWSALPLRALLFGEAQGRVVVSTAEAADVLAIARRHGVPARQIGAVRAAAPALRITVAGRTIAAPLERLADAYHGAIPRAMNDSVAAVAVAEETFTPVP